MIDIYSLILLNSSCLPAAARPQIKLPCTALQYNSFCKSKGIKLDKYVFMSRVDQMKYNEKVTQFDKQSKSYLLSYIISKACRKAVEIVYCHHYFPACDTTGDVLKPQKLCKETCEFFKKTCSLELSIARSFINGNYPDIIDCAEFSERNAGVSPECYYFDGMIDKRGRHYEFESRNWRRVADTFPSF